MSTVTENLSAQAEQPRRGRFVPGLRLYALLGIGLLLPLILSWAFNGSLGLQWASIGLYNLTIGAIAFWDYRRAAQWRIRLERICESKLSIGRDNTVHLKLTVLGHPARAIASHQESAAPLEIRDGYPPLFRTDQNLLKVALTPELETELSYHVFPPSRGQMGWRTAALRVRSPWGLCWRMWELSLETTVDVYPDLIGLRLLSIRLSLETTGNLQRRFKVGGTEFSELRDYSVGDDIRMIDWKASARSQRPIVRLLEPEREQPLIILLDRGRLMTAQVEGLRRFDWALNAALALALAGLRRGDRVGIAVFDKTIHTWIAPQPGLVHLSHILERLHTIEPEAVESDYVGVASQVLNQYTRRALVVMLTDIVDEIASQELLGAMGRLSPRFLPLCVALRDPEIDAQAHPAHPPEKVQQLYTQSVALDLLHQRQVAFAKLQQRGSMVINAPASKISVQLVEQYLRLKARGRL
jgi:uncharacterized protein (DUF58 family)